MEKKYNKYLLQFNNETRQHSLNVAKLCKQFAYTEDLNEDLAYKVGLLHDIGKIYIPSRILKKDTKLDNLERQIIDLHSYYGYKLLKEELKEPPEIYLSALYHHGYGKVKLENINEPITENAVKLIRLVHCLDIFEAMTSERIYHKARSPLIALEVVENDDMCSDYLKKELHKVYAEKC